MQRFHYTFFIQCQLHRVVTLVPIISGFELKENLKVVIMSEHAGIVYITPK